MLDGSRCPYISGGIRCALDEGHGGDHRATRDPASPPFVAEVVITRGDERVTDRGLCLWCEEPVLDGERAEAGLFITGDGRPADTLRWRHWECAARSALGSVAHQEGRCSCYGGSGEDDPGLSRREAARAALEAAQKRFATTWPPDSTSQRSEKP